MRSESFRECFSLIFLLENWESFFHNHGRDSYLKGRNMFLISVFEKVKLNFLHNSCQTSDVKGSPLESMQKDLHQILYWNRDASCKKFKQIQSIEKILEQFLVLYQYQNIFRTQELSKRFNPNPFSSLPFRLFDTAVFIFYFCNHHNCTSLAFVACALFSCRLLLSMLLFTTRSYYNYNIQ